MRLLPPKLFNIEYKIIQRLEGSEDLALREGVFSDHPILLYDEGKSERRRQRKVGSRQQRHPVPLVLVSQPRAPRRGYH
jgi:hypothetical protein